MNIKDIADHASVLAGVVVDALKARRYINEAIENLSIEYDTACTKSTTTIVCDDIEKEYSLPADCIGVTRVVLDNSKYNNYTVKDGLIEFDNTGTFTVTYEKMTSLTDKKVYESTLSTDIPAVNELYHRALPFYVAAHVLMETNINDERISAFLVNYSDLTEKADTRLKRLKRRGNRIKVPLFR